MIRDYKGRPNGRPFSWRWMIGMAFLSMMAACNGRRTNRVVFHLNGAFHRHFVIERVGLNDERPTMLDSGIGRSNRDSFVYRLPPSEATIYRIRLQGRSLVLPFIYDSSDMAIFYNYTTGQYHFTGSPASTEWQRFEEGQMAIAREERRWRGRPDDPPMAGLDSLLHESYIRNYDFSDTVSNPALFLLAYNLVDYGRDYTGLEQFIQRAGRRFPRHTGVQDLVRNTLDFVRTFRSPLKIGDTLPHLWLPDSNGRAVDIGPVPGKYLLVDYWSTWCDQCRIFSDAKKKAWSRADTGRLAMVSIAVDARKDAWKKVIAYERYPWVQVIDEKMWSGPAARTFRFDSLPFNYLVGPDGRIVAKAISADSLAPVLSSLSIIPKK